MTTLNTENRIWYFDFLRVGASIFVIILHLSAQNFDSVAVGSYEWMVFNVCDSLSRWAVPIFVMISGALFLAPERKIYVKKLYTQNLLRIITAFVFWSGVYALSKYLQGTRLRTIVFEFLKGGSHLWFLYMIAGLYLLIPLLRKLTESEKLMRYFLLLWFLFSVFVPTVRGILGFFADYYTDWLDVIVKNLKLHFISGYTGYFILGHWLHRQNHSKKRRRIIYVFGVFGAGMTILFTYLLSKKRGYLDTTFYDELSVFVFIVAAALFVFVKYHAPQCRNTVVRKLLITLSKCSFGIYLVHYYLVSESMNLFNINTLSFSPLLTIPALTGIVFVCSFFVSFVLNKIPVVKKYLV